MSAQTFTRLAYRVHPPVARIALHNPFLNIIDIPMMEELCQAIADAEVQPDVSVLVLSGENEVFSAGVDVAAHTPDKVEAMLRKFHAIFRALVSSRKVLIGAVRGACLGGGAELAIMCDIVITSDSATWGFPEISLGCFPPVAVTALASVVGQKNAADLILTGRKISGAEAHVMGLANLAVPNHQVQDHVDELVGRLAKLSSAALAVSKKSMYVWDAMHFDKGLARAEKIYLEELIRTEDAREGIRAFLQKREPQWTGK